MKKFKRNRFYSLFASITLLTAPVITVVACDSDLDRYGLALPNDVQNRILFDFIGVNYSVDVKSQFSAALQQGMELIKKDTEGIMAQQEFYDIFVQKLGYSADKANETFNAIKDNLGLNILAADYFNTLNQGKDFDAKVIKQNKLIFQTENWHLLGTTKFNYNYENSFYGQEGNNPDEIFTTSYLYSDLNGDNATKKDEKIKEVAKHADTEYNNEIQDLTKGQQTWATAANREETPTLGTTSIKDYQKKLERFKWWLRFRYQQYYYSTIAPQLNDTLFTMANIFNSILDINKTSNSKPVIQIKDTKYAGQLQTWEAERAWDTKYRWTWDYTVSQSAAININNNWDDPDKNLLTDLIKDGSLNPDFFKSLATATDEKTKNSLNPVLGINGYVSNTADKKYDTAVKSTRNAQWVNNDADGFHYWGANGQGSFAYSAPVYWIDVVQNLNFNYYNDKSKDKEILADTNSQLIKSWTNPNNAAVSETAFSQFMRGANVSSEDYEYTQELKWNTMWQMIYSLSSQEDTNANKDVAADNFNTAAKALFPKYIKKENVYSTEFWDAIKSFY